MLVVPVAMPIGNIVFKNLTDDEEKNLVNKISELKSWDIFKRKKLSQELKNKRATVFEVLPSIDETKFGTFIKIQEARKQMAKESESLKSGNLNSLLKILAFIIKPSHEGYDSDSIKRRAKIFEQLPAQKALSIVGFFLSEQINFLKASQT